MWPEARQHLPHGVFSCINFIITVLFGCQASSSSEPLFVVGLGLGTSGIFVITLASILLIKTPLSVVMLEAGAALSC